MNDVEIVVKSNDKTTMTEIGQRFKTSLSRSIKDGMTDVDRTTSQSFRQIGDRAGAALGNSLKQGMQEATQDVDVLADHTQSTSVAARRMGLAVQEAADRAARADRDAANAAERLKAAETAAAEAQKAAAEAAAKLERGEIKEAEAKKIAADAASKAAAAEQEKTRASDAAARASRAAERSDLARAAAAEAAAKATAKQAREADKAAEKDRDLARKAAKDAEKSFEDLVRESSKSASGVEGGFAQAFREMGAQWKAVAIANAIVALPTLASVAAGGVSLALGGAFAAVGLIAQAKSADIKNAFSDLRKHVSSELKDMTAPFHDTLGHMIDDARRGFDSLDLAKPFAVIAPAVTKFSAQFASSLSRLNPLFASIGTAFSRTLGALGPRMDAIMNNLATGIKAVTDQAGRDPAAFANFAENISKIVRYTGDGIGLLARYKDEFNGFMQVFAGGGPLGMFKFIDGLVKLKGIIGHALFGDSGKSFTDLGVAAGNAGAGMVKTGMATQQLLTAQKAAAMTSDQLKTALDNLTGANQTAFDAQTSYTEALKAARTQAKNNNAALDGSSKAVDGNRRALSDLATTTKSWIETGDLSAKQVERLRQNFVNVAHGMGLSTGAAKDLADRLLGVAGSAKKVPGKVTTHLEAKDNTKGGTASAQKNLKNIKSTYRASLTAVDKTLGAVISAGKKVRGFASGLYRAQLTASNKVAGPVSAAARACLGFARRAYRAQLTAVNKAVGVIRGAIRLAQQFARPFTAHLNVIRNFVGGIFGHGAAGTIAGGIGAMASGGALRGMAAGGSGSALTLVGEQGAELVRLPTGATVVPHGNSMNQLARMGGGALTVNLEVTGGLGSDFERMFVQMIRKFVRVTAGGGPGNVQKAFG